MKILTVLGTRPEIIRLSRIIPKLDELCDHVLVHTGQNYDRRLNELFFDQLGVRKPDETLAARGSFGEQVGQILAGCERILTEHSPDRLLILGDTNSGLAAILAKRMGIPVYHMEAGNRCYDDRVPEEVNRRIIDHSSDVLMPYTERSRQNLLREGIEGQRIYVTGNPIYEVLRHYESQISASPVLEQLQLAAGHYFLVTMHRAENVDLPERLQQLVDCLEQLQHDHAFPVIVSTHPRTRDRIRSFQIACGNAAVRYVDPLGFFDFVQLERNAACVLTDSGTVQEECAIFGVRNVTIRDVTERPETLECGSNVLVGAEPTLIRDAIRGQLQRKDRCSPPREYVADGVSQVVVNVLTSFRRHTRGS